MVNSMGYYDDYLSHHGVKGQKWGVRRYQNENGTLTPAGEKRYGGKVTIHNKSNILLGGRKYQNHKEYVTANKFAKGTYLQNKQKIKEQKQKDLAKADTFGKKVDVSIKTMQKNADNRAQYKYELDRNRKNAGVNEFKRDAAIGAAKRGAKAAAIVGAGIVAGMLHANYMNNRNKRNVVGALPMNDMDSYYEYKIGKKKVAKYLGKAVALGAIYGATNSFIENYNVQERINKIDQREKAAGVTSTRAKRAAEDEERWKKGQV